MTRAVARRPGGAQAVGEALEALNRRIMDAVNASGKIYITHTRLGGDFCLRVSIGQTYTQRRHVEQAWKVIGEEAARAGTA